VGFAHSVLRGLPAWPFADHYGRWLTRDFIVHRPLPLITELDRRARALGLSCPQLAERIGLDRSQLSHIRRGRDRISLGTLHLIGLWFPSDATIQRLAWEYIVHDVETPVERRRREQSRSAEAETYAQRLSEDSVAQLRAFVADLPAHALDGAGLLLTSNDTSALSAAVSFLACELHSRRIQAIRQTASARVPSSAGPELVAAQVLLAERVDHASPSMADVLRLRAAYRKLTVGTSVGGDGLYGPHIAASVASRSSSSVVEASSPTIRA